MFHISNTFKSDQILKISFARNMFGPLHLNFIVSHHGGNCVCLRRIASAIINICIVSNIIIRHHKSLPNIINHHKSLPSIIHQSTQAGPQLLSLNQPPAGSAIATTHHAQQKVRHRIHLCVKEPQPAWHYELVEHKHQQAW